MIQNDEQLATTKEWVARFGAALDSVATEPLHHPDPRMREIRRAALASQLEDLRDQVRAYEAGDLPSHQITPEANGSTIQADDVAAEVLDRVALLETMVLQLRQEVADLRLELRTHHLVAQP